MELNKGWQRRIWLPMVIVGFLATMLWFIPYVVGWVIVQIKPPANSQPWESGDIWGLGLMCSLALTAIGFILVHWLRFIKNG